MKPKKKRETSDTLFSVYDLGVWKNADGILAKSIYEPPELGYKYIACIRKGTPLEPLAVVKKQVMCQFGDEVVMIPAPLLKE